MDKEIESLDPKLKARLIRIVELIGSMGPAGVGATNVEHHREKLWDMRMKGPSGISRVDLIYSTRSQSGYRSLRRKEITIGAEGSS